MKLEDLKVFARLQEVEETALATVQAETAADQAKEDVLVALFDRAEERKERIILSLPSLEVEIGEDRLWLKKDPSLQSREYLRQDALHILEDSPEEELCKIIQAFLDNKKELEVKVFPL